VGPKPNHLKMTESIGARMKPAMGKVAAAAALALEGQGTMGRGLHSSTFQLNLSRF
jgi:hypothetical protein